MKRVTVEAFFPELKGNPYRTAHGEASSWPAAVSRAVKDLAKKVKGKHISSVSLTVSIGTTQVLEPETEKKQGKLYESDI